MNEWAAPPSADRVPTLTEVVDLAAPASGGEPGLDDAPWPAEAAPESEGLPVVEEVGSAPQAEPDPAPDVGELPPILVWDGVDAPTTDVPFAVAPIEAGPAAPAATEMAPAIDTAAIVALALAELQPRLDMLLESRLREALAPALARAAEGLIREARGELASALNELLNDAVRRALQRQVAQAPGAEGAPPHRP